MPTAMHLQSVQAQHTLTTSDKSMTFYLDEQCNLLIKPKSASYPYPLAAVDTLALANLLHIFYADIAEEAKKYNGPKEIGRKEIW